MSLRSILLLACLLAAPSLWATPVSFSLVGVSDTNDTADVTFAYNASLAKVLLDIKNTSALYDPRITSFAFNLPTSVTGFSSFSGPTGWSGLYDPNDIDTPGQFGFYDMAGLTGPNFNGGSPNQGIPPSSTFHFEISLSGSGLGSLTESSFLSILSYDPPGGPNEAEQYFIARFQRTGANGSGSDVAIPGSVQTPPPPQVPEPASLLLLGAGLSGLGLVRRRSRKS